MHIRQVTGLLLAILFVAASTVFAQEAIVQKAAPIFLLPDSTRVPLRTAAPNTRLRVIEEGPEGWVKVEFQDPQFGPRTGYIQATHITIRRPELEPMDLSVGPGQPAAPVPASAPNNTTPTTQAVTRGPRFPRGWFDINFGVAVPGESRYGTVFEAELFGEIASSNADYHSPTGAAFDFGGGFMFTPNFGLGLMFAGTAHQDVAQLGVSIPHPTFANSFATDDAETEDKLTRAEGSVHIQAMFVAPISPKVTARVYGGPSYFRIQQDAVRDIDVNYTFLLLAPVHAVDIVGYQSARIEYDDGGGWGFHIGSDVAYFFNRVVGLGAFARYSYGKVEVLEPLSEARHEFKTGGFQSGGGLRLRF